MTDKSATPMTDAPEGQVRTCPTGKCRVLSPQPCNCFADPMVAAELAVAKEEVANDNLEIATLRRRLAEAQKGMELAWSIAKDRRDKLSESVVEYEQAEKDLDALEAAGFTKHIPSLEEVRGIFCDAAIAQEKK
jgi:hypothetical protein